MRFLTLTAHLLAETTYTFERWSEGATQRARCETFQVGGKGINVTRLLHRLGAETLALCFPGGATGERCLAWLRAKPLPTHPFPTGAETRTGTVVRAPGRSETTFLGAENVIDATAIRACAAWLEAHAASDDVIVIGGSMPHWDDARWQPLREVLARRTASGGALVVDTYGAALPWFAAQPAALVKINRKEFAALAGVSPAATTDTRMPDLLARTADASAVAAWIVTDGPNRVWFVERGGTVQHVMPPSVAEVSPTGSGDVLMAGVLYARGVRGGDVRGALEFALPLAAANAASPDVAEFDLAPFRR